MTGVRQGLSEHFLAPLILSRGLVFLIAALAPVVWIDPALPFPILYVDPPVIGAFARWDSAYYMAIAIHGYSEVEFYAFRPLYPLILSLVSQPFYWLGSRTAQLVGGFLWNLGAFMLTGVYLHRLTAMLLGLSYAQRTLILLSVYPSSFILSAIYPEATSLLLTVMTIYYLERGKILASAFSGFMAGLARPESFLLFVPFLLRTFSTQHRMKMALATFIVFLSLPTFGLFSYYNTGNPATPFIVEEQWPKTTLLKFFNSRLINPLVLLNFLVMGVATFFVVLPLTKRNDLTRRALPYFVWSLALLVLFYAVGNIGSWARLTVTMPTILWSQAYYSSARPRLFATLVVSFTMLMSLSTFLFAAWYPLQ